MDQKVLIIIPAFNEENNLPKVLIDVQQHIPYADILVINDGSTDRTLDICIERNINFVTTVYSLGIGGAMQTGYKFALENDYDIAIQLDGDGQHSAKEIDRLLEPLLKGNADVVIGSRFIEDKGYKFTIPRLIGIKLFSFITSIITQNKITDVTSGFRAVNRKTIRFFANEYAEDFPDAETLIMLSFSGFIITEIPAIMHQRMSGHSSIDSIKSIKYLFKTSISILAVVLHKQYYKKFRTS